MLILKHSGQWMIEITENLNIIHFQVILLRRGIGVQIDGRAFQWSNSLAANAIFFVWSITNVSNKTLDTVVFGIYGDPDIGYYGRGGNEPADDNGLFISPFDSVINGQNIPLYARNMVYFFDPDGVGDKAIAAWIFRLQIS